MVELTLIVVEQRVEAVSDALLDDGGALSVSVEDADADSGAERALFGEPGLPAPAAGWKRSTVKALFENRSAAIEALNRLRESSDAAAVLSSAAAVAGAENPSITDVPDVDWVRLTQSQFAPVAVTPSFWIVPSWHAPPPEAVRVIRLDPGLAFGTGTHPTTRMCLRWTADHAVELAPTWNRVLDYGCGSGILAIGAALHGAREVDAVDIDPGAVDTSRANARDNGVALNCGLPSQAHGSYDLVFANILASPLKLLAPLLCAHLHGGADLVLAGILERQADELRAAYAPWLALDVSDVDDGWILMTGRRAV